VNLPVVESGGQPAAARFAVIGDYGLEGQPLADVAALVKSWNPDFIVTTGDNNYPSGSAETIDANIGQYFHEYIAPYQGSYGPGGQANRFFPALGNHDLDTAGGQAYFDYFDLPGNERYYDISWGPVHLFVLNSDSREPDGIGRSSVQAAWLQERLAASTAPWKLVILHHAPYSSGTHGSDRAVQWPFAAWGASAVLSGHDHTYERLLVDGLPYFVNGLGGGARYEFPQFLPESQARFRDDYGAMLVTADPQGIVFELYTHAGVLVDRYALGEPVAAAQPSQPVEAAEQAGGPLPDPADYTWELYLAGPARTVGLEPAPDGSGRLFLIQQSGLIYTARDGSLEAQPFLDIRERVGSQGNEQGLLGLAFHPRFAENGYFYVNYTDLNGNTVIARFQAQAGADQADPASEKRLLFVAQPYPNHNGGHLAFGPDGYLYIGLGDGGAAGDPQDNAQNMGTLLGKLARIDVDGGDPYAIPADNPYINGGGLAEIWASGLRNPWRYSFDPLTGDLYIADVGQNQWEEVNYLPAGAAGGANFGWDYREASHAFSGSPPAGLALIEPVAEYDHTQGCSVSGGVVYRGQRLPAWQGVFLYGDFCSGLVWGLKPDAAGGWQNERLFELDARIAGFAEDASGELYLVSLTGEIYRLAER
jgi:glucose/arabinose dehydrogenase